MKRIATTLCALLINTAALMPYTAHADALADIKARGTLVCGVVSGSPPFGYQDTETRQLVGYDVDFCKAIAQQLGVKPELKVVSIDARIPELQQGRVDVLAAVLGYNRQRAEQISFSKAYFATGQMIAVKTQSTFKTRDDMSGKRISAIKGTSAAPMMQRVLPSAQLIYFDDGPSAFMALVQNKVDGFLLAEPQMRRFINRLGNDAKTITVLTPPVGTEFWGLGVRKGEPALLGAVNAVLDKMEASGQTQTIFDTWLGDKSPLKMTRQFKTIDIPNPQE
ncbi:ABC transporter glutamine-binding protein GlnH [Pandoraea anhela]|uniref:ABC transporter glutamine-binding protein GlnH n=2 Tax=Pandoraea anhela TaxID=2508295 RepID=A0A5E4W9N5_9BURK|nr:ABC transporter glutamine-binding protein GlnH [Pandoraea anhela]